MAEEEPSDFHQHPWLHFILSDNDGEHQGVHDNSLTRIDDHPDEEKPIQPEVPGWAGQSVEEEKAEVSHHLHEVPQSCLAF